MDCRRDIRLTFSSTEMYLRHWVNGNPSSLLVSVNYTKAPGAIYPQAVNECFFAYKVLVEVGFLGFRPRKVILAGDSAGGNLVLAVTIRAIQEGLRVPDALLVAYPATDLRRSITLSRFLFGHDVLLPYDLIVLALEAYAPSDKCDASKDPLVSPILAPDEILAKFPNKMLFMSASLDPLLDDCSAFLQRLRAVHKNPRWILLDLPHGFWNMAAVLPSARLSVTMGTEFIASVISDQ
jgi:hormone-sensitive lipase